MSDELRANRRAPVENDIDLIWPRPRRGLWALIAAGTIGAFFLAVVALAYWQGEESSAPGVPPIVKADPGPTKIKPDEPGGQAIPFQNSTVYDRLGQGEQKPQAEKLLPPPEAPVQRPLAAAAPSAVPPVAAAPVAPPPVAVQPAAPLPRAPDRQVVAAIPKPDAGAAAALAPKPASPTQAAAPIPIIPAAPPPVAAPSLAAITPAAPMPAKPAAGSVYRIQVGLADTPEAAAAEWARLKERFPQTLGPLRMSTDKVDGPDKGIAYRIQAGPFEEGKAKAACAKMNAQGADCVPVASAPPAAVASIAPAQASPRPTGASGDYRIQLGSVKTQDAADTEWKRLKGRFPELLAPLNMASEKVEVADKGIFYRIRVGPFDQESAKSACERLKVQGVTCIVVKS